MGRVNVQWLRRQLIKLTDGRPQDWTFWTRFPSPELVQAIEALPFRRNLYEPIDRYDASLDFSPSERGRIALAEARLLSRATVIAGSRSVAERFQQAAGGSTWIPFGCDCGVAKKDACSMSAGNEIRIGVVAEFDWRVDEQLISRIADERPNWKLVLVGPLSKRWGAGLARLKNIEFIGRVDAPEVAGHVASFNVALIPYVLNDWTRACLPVKVYEYLAQGRPVVSTQLPELAPFSEVVDLAPANDFGAAIKRALDSDSPAARERRVQASTRFTLQDRARKAVELLEGKPVVAAVL